MRRVLVRRRRLRNRSRKEADGWSSVVGGEKLSLMSECSTTVRPFVLAADFKRSIACSDLPLKSIHLGDSGTRAGISTGMMNRMVGTDMASRRWVQLGKSQAIPARAM